MNLLLEQIAVPPGQILLLRDMSWGQYEAMLVELGNCRNTRIAYDRGTVELMTPLSGHEFSNRAIERFLSILTEELDIPCQPYGSTTLNRPDLARGAEPDSCYYLRNRPCFRDGRLDLLEGAAPDLVVEIDITHRDLDKAALYARLGVTEFWRFDGETLQIFELRDGGYRRIEQSTLLPNWVDWQWCDRFIEQCHSQGMTAASRLLRRQVRAVIERQV